MSLPPFHPDSDPLDCGQPDCDICTLGLMPGESRDAWKDRLKARFSCNPLMIPRWGRPPKAAPVIAVKPAASEWTADQWDDLLSQIAKEGAA